MIVDVSLVPGEKPEQNCENKIAVIIDVFRATSSIAYALYNGCEALIPVATIQEARQIYEKYPEIVLAGERKGHKISGFDLGNSPLEFTSKAVSKKKIVITTTNGTRALKQWSGAHRVYTAAFINSGAIIGVLRRLRKDVIIICAGSDGKFSLEDALCAGLIVDNLQNIGALTDTALAAMAMYRDRRTSIVEDLTASSHARYLINNGFGDDIQFCVQRDIVDVVPFYAHDAITVQNLKAN